MDDLKLNLYKDVTDPVQRCKYLESELQMWKLIADHRKEYMEMWYRQLRIQMGLPPEPKKEEGQ